MRKRDFPYWLTLYQKLDVRVLEISLFFGMKGWGSLDPPLVFDGCKIL